MKTLHIAVLDKVATYRQRDGEIVCGNADYQISFAFDSEWLGAETKTARFIYGNQFTDVVFTGDTCAVPVMRNVTQLTVGVFAGDLMTTTPASIPCVKSIRCEGGAPAEPTPDVYDQIMEKINNARAKNDVTTYGAKGDGSADDTAAFKAALAAERVLFVPGGTYKLTSGIVIGNNCMLELAQDAVLNFTITSGNCITLGMLSTLKGNHATVNVPYEFGGNVLYSYSNTHTDAEQRLVPPWTKWSPQWKSGRYVTDLNICKEDSRGFHYAVNPEDCKGTAVYLSADNTVGLLGYMWGIHFSGLRIAGAFTYGIRAENFDEGWLHEMRIDAFIDACEIGVSLVDCNNAYVSAIVQPRKAYTTDGVYKAYAKHGIQLIRSRNADLSGSRVWDWDADKTLWTDGGEYQSYAMIGDCRGALINDFAYFTTSYDIRERIYTDSDINLDTMRVLQEPITKYFKVLNDEPYYSDGVFDHKIITQEHLDKHFDTGIIKNFTDVLETAIDVDGGIYNGVGYKKNTRINVDGSMVESGYYVSTGFIPCAAGSEIYAHDMSFSAGDDNCRIIFYDKNFNVCKYGTNNTPLHINRGLLLKNGNTYVAEYTELADGFKLTVNGGQYGPHANTAYVRFVIYKTVWGENPMVAVDEQIAYTVEGFLADGVKVKGENVIGNVGEVTPDWIATKESTGGDEVVIPEQNVSSGMWKNRQMDIQPGITYDVHINDVVYPCKAYNEDGGIILGNNTALTMNDLPFCIYWAGGTATSGFFYENSALSYPIKLKVTDHKEVVYNKMPEGYLPDSVTLFCVNISAGNDYSCSTPVSTLEAVLGTDRLIAAKITTDTGVLFAQLCSYETSANNSYGRIVMFALGTLAFTLTPTSSGSYEVTVSGD